MNKVTVGALGLVFGLLGLVSAGSLADAGNGSIATLQVDPATSEAPATVTVSNTGDADSTCEDPHVVEPDGAAPAVGGVSVTVTLSDDNGTVQTDTVTPDGSGNWSVTYTNLPSGNYTATASCSLEVNGNGATPEANAPFTYQAVQFVVTTPATTPTAPTTVPAEPAGGVVAARPAFTG